MCRFEDAVCDVQPQTRVRDNQSHGVVVHYLAPPDMVRPRAGGWGRQSWRQKGNREPSAMEALSGLDVDGMDSRNQGVGGRRGGGGRRVGGQYGEPRFVYYGVNNEVTEEKEGAMKAVQELLEMGGTGDEQETTTNSTPSQFTLTTNSTQFTTSTYPTITSSTTIHISTSTTTTVPTKTETATQGTKSENTVTANITSERSIPGVLPPSSTSPSNSVKEDKLEPVEPAEADETFSTVLILASVSTLALLLTTLKYLLLLRRRKRERQREEVYYILAPTNLAARRESV